MNLFNLIATLTLNNQAYKQGLKDSDKEAKSFSSKAGVAFKSVGKAITAVVGIVTTAAAAFAKLTLNSIQYGDTIADNSVKLGISTDTYQTFSYALQQAGVSADSLSNYVRYLTSFTQDLADGNGDALVALDRLGVGYEEFMSMSADDQIMMITSAFQGLEDGIDKTAIAQQIFGDRMYQQFMPLLSDAAESIGDTSDKLDELGLRMSEDTVKSADKLSDKLLLLKSAMTILTNNAVSGLYPALGTLLDGLTGLITGSIDTDEALGMVKDSFSSLLKEIVTNLPTILSTAGTILIDLIDILLESISDPEFVNGVFDLIETILLKAIEVLPSVLKSIAKLIPAIIDALLNLDWGTIITELIFVLTEFFIEDLPNMITSIIKSILDFVLSGKLFTLIAQIGVAFIMALISVFVSNVSRFGDFINAILNFVKSGDALSKIGKIGLSIAQTLINGLINGVESGINAVIDGINKLLSIKIAGVSIGVTIPKLSIPRVSFLKDGGLFEDLINMAGGKGTAYAIAGEAGAEIVAQGSRGTGVTNVAQFRDAMIEAQEYTFPELAEMIINGLLSVLSMRSTNNTSSGQNIVVQIGDKEFKSYVTKSVNDNLKQSGRKSLNSITRY